MKEDFLHYVWKFQKFSPQGLKTVQGESLQILNPGLHNTDAGPDFLMGQIALVHQVWAGNIEIHTKSSEWYAHGHEQDSNYNNVILHVVWEHDIDIFRSDETAIPTLVLKGRLNEQVLQNYQNLFASKSNWIQCEPHFSEMDSLYFRSWMDTMFLERLEDRSLRIDNLLLASKNHWEQVLFQLLGRSFGLLVNGDSFFSIVRSIPYGVVQKCRHDASTLEALLLGQAGLLDQIGGDTYYEELRRRYLYIVAKYGVSNDGVDTPKFFRLRPVNFPTIRLSQFSVLWHSRPSLFSYLISLKTVQECYELLHVKANSYWDTHYNFGVRSACRKKRLTERFMDLLIVNVIIPLQYSYWKKQGKDISENIIALALSISAEKNTVIEKFKELRDIEGNAFESQALLQLKHNYCDKKRCLQCALGNHLLRR